MNAPSSLRPVTGKVDDQGCLIEADPLLLRLHERAGGVRGGPLAVPQLATLVRLARLKSRQRIASIAGEGDAGGISCQPLIAKLTPLPAGVT